jgi:hypothetical protein
MKSITLTFAKTPTPEPAPCLRFVATLNKTGEILFFEFSAVGDDRTAAAMLAYSLGCKTETDTNDR